MVKEAVVLIFKLVYVSPNGTTKSTTVILKKSITHFFIKKIKNL